MGELAWTLWRAAVYEGRNSRRWESSLSWCLVTDSLQSARKSDASKSASVMKLEAVLKTFFMQRDMDFLANTWAVWESFTCAARLSVFAISSVREHNLNLRGDILGQTWSSWQRAARTAASRSTAVSLVSEIASRCHNNRLVASAWAL